MKKEIACESMTIKITTPGVMGQINLISQPDLKNRADGKKIYVGDLNFSVSNIIQTPCGTASPGMVASATISPTATKNMVGGKNVLRVGDKVTGLSAVGATQPASPTPTPCSITFDVEITDAGQNKVRAE